MASTEIDPEDRDYVCSLSEFSLEKAKRELNEDPSQRLGQVKALRDWIKSQPHFTFRTDTDYLLQVLRKAKFSQLKAREIVEAVLTMRTKCPEYMVNLDTHEPAIIRFVERGAVIPLPKTTADGHLIIIGRIVATDLNDPLMTPVNEMRTSLAVQEMLKEKNENLIVNGVHLVFDLTGMSMKHLTRSSAAENKTTTKIHQDCSMGRMKAFHLYNGGTFAEVIIGLIKTLMKKKYAERVYVHNTMESLYKLFPMELWPDEYLPDDYKGPSAGSIKDICENLKKRMMDPNVRARVLDYTHERYKIDLNKKDTNTVQASFRKLNID